MKRIAVVDFHLTVNRYRPAVPSAKCRLEKYFPVLSLLCLNFVDTVVAVQWMHCGIAEEQLLVPYLLLLGSSQGSYLRVTGK